MEELGVPLNSIVEVGQECMIDSINWRLTHFFVCLSSVWRWIILDWTNKAEQEVSVRIASLLILQEKIPESRVFFQIPL